MQNSDNRLESFKAISKPKSKAKPAFPLSPSTHPQLTPEALSQAGFHHTPGSSSSATDNCKCFLCGVELGGWDEDDDPFQEHARRGNCAWAEMVCAVTLERRKRDQSDGKYTTTYTTPESLPQSNESNFVREQTYKKWWPHKQKSGWLPTVKNLSRAGFVYTPSTDSKDLVTCPYCDYAVEGWEATDDPWQVHQKKVPDCHFFRAELESEAPGPSEPKTASKASSRGKKSEASKRSKRTTTAAATALSEADEQPEPSTLPSEDEGSIAPTAKERTTKPRATTTTKAKGKAGGRGKKKAAASEVETEASEVEAEHTVIVVDDQSDDEIPVAESVVERVDGEEEEVETKTEKGKSRAKNSTVKAKPRATTTKAKSTSRSKSNPSRKKKVDDSPEEEAETAVTESEVEPEVESGAEAEADMGEVEEAEPETTPRPLAKSTTTSKSSKPSGKPSTTTSQSKSNSQSSSQSTNSSKPLPSLPPRSAPTSPSPVKQPASQSIPPGGWTSQLDRFTKIPPSSPIVVVSPSATPRSKSTLRSTHPVRPSPHANLTRDVLDSSLNRGALEARKVLDDLMSSPQFNAGSNENSADANRTTTGPRLMEQEVLKPLTDEQKGMTLEDLVRVEMDDKYSRMKAEGEAMIEQFLRRTVIERKKIEGL
ncbi:hypothetical protein I316_05711 [Kwoniella heveanensis BCC8398]|uniref:BIR-domain-containing protein n=1 Tax=Kwoniella heveanensis BCC8398 TaxID=1296120 RepID=A0A1B9GNF6_9TREE|nr:hypothetical protein I316_05711 [Kwoniella heveanensis BCC8398]